MRSFMNSFSSTLPRYLCNDDTLSTQQTKPRPLNPSTPCKLNRSKIRKKKVGCDKEYRELFFPNREHESQEKVNASTSPDITPISFSNTLPNQLLHPFPPPSPVPAQIGAKKS